MRRIENIESSVKPLSFYAIIDITCLGERDEKGLINWLLSHNCSNRNVDST